MAEVLEGPVRKASYWGGGTWFLVGDRNVNDVLERWEGQVVRLTIESLARREPQYRRAERLHQRSGQSARDPLVLGDLPTR